METEKKSVTLTVAWVLLLIIGLLIVLGGAGSMVLGFRFRTRICRRRSASPVSGSRRRAPCPANFKAAWSR